MRARTRLIEPWDGRTARATRRVCANQDGEVRLSGWIVSRRVDGDGPTVLISSAAAAPLRLLSTRGKESTGRALIVVFCRDPRRGAVGRGHANFVKLRIPAPDYAEGGLKVEHERVI